ncbi:16S rRNA (guanine(527)-N(7))-methyltransferase RsmG [Oscillospiraceae bacterium MB08-C2-2]|nr:16S rRNA (guanine(527)-N(7))-methyltransferase RsmG [Oscillospiraceae bacterium MB08-C2-2]
MLDREKLIHWAGELGIELAPSMVEQMDEYASFLVEYNQKVNLTAITQPVEIAVKHFLDSLLLLRAGELKQGATLLDVGTGAGFPGVPLKIARPDLQVTLMDSLQKRIVFLEELSRRLGQDTRCIHGRGEELGNKPVYRESFDWVTARAVAGLPVLCEYCLPFVRVGGTFAALKGPDAAQELAKAERAIEFLGGKVQKLVPFDLPLDNHRVLVLIKKIRQTPPKYPRNAGKITKTPL